MKSKVDEFIDKVIDQIIIEKGLTKRPEPLLCNINLIAQQYIQGVRNERFTKSVSVIRHG